MADQSPTPDPDDPLAPARGLSLDGLLDLLEQLDGREECGVVREALARDGVEVHFSDHEISHSIYFADPDGHELELTTYEV